jgi:hypothetical protein
MNEPAKLTGYDPVEFEWDGFLEGGKHLLQALVSDLVLKASNQTHMADQQLILKLFLDKPIILIAYSLTWLFPIPRKFSCKSIPEDGSFSSIN